MPERISSFATKGSNPQGLTLTSDAGKHYLAAAWMGKKVRVSLGG
jgi:hypothetical protein